jgi:hypothetical protein
MPSHSPTIMSWTPLFLRSVGKGKRRAHRQCRVPTGAPRLTGITCEDDD